ncbi:hypothetical protein Q0Z83_015190 [Actinoplanes sichuanensis]|uniref:Uncharacterized protein n=1 Tax=Actinoplanes sichuanensis TaxID=512349 RepID=A0ABW4A8E5_9ACTN|nr:hypothetical protein [Actinoplanes sichuanensis]BEL03328.1 hypothetical protein Q0Z83_015190 [Actinoplanes sichuanensis]
MRDKRNAIALHALAVVIFGLLLWTGVTSIGSGAEALGIPMIITGGAGSAGSLTIVVSMLRDPTRPTTRQVARLGMVIAAAVAVIIGVVLAPADTDRSFVIAVDVLIGTLLATFAALAGDRRPAQLFDAASRPAR